MRKRFKFKRPRFSGFRRYYSGFRNRFRSFRFYRPFRRKNKLFSTPLIIGLLIVAGFLFKDKLTPLFNQLTGKKA